MSLLNLLTVGNSFCSIEDHLSPYRMRPGTRLPHFGEAEPSDARGDSNQSILNVPAPAAADSRRRIAQDLFKSETRSGRMPRPDSKTVPEVRPPVTCLYPAAGWPVKPPFCLSHDSGVRTKAVPVQQDFPWENIPVARNDLTEADLEVVPVPRKPEAAGATASPRKAKTLFGSFLGRLKTRLIQGARK